MEIIIEIYTLVVSEHLDSSADRTLSSSTAASGRQLSPTTNG